MASLVQGLLSAMLVPGGGTRADKMQALAMMAGAMAHEQERALWPSSLLFQHQAPQCGAHPLSGIYNTERILLAELKSGF